MGMNMFIPFILTSRWQRQHLLIATALRLQSDSATVASGQSKLIPRVSQSAEKNLRFSFGFSLDLLFSYIINMTVCNGKVFSQMQSLLPTATLNSPEDAFRNVSDICRMVSYDGSPSPTLPAHRLQCKCSPFVSVDQMSQCLLCWSAGLLIRPEQREQSLGRVLPALSLYLHRLCVHTCMENPPVYQAFFTSSRNIFIVQQSYCGTINPCQPFFFRFCMPPQL